MSDRASSSPPARRLREFAAHVLPALVWVVLVFIGGGLHQPPPEIDPAFPIDKLEHAAAFLILQLLAYRALSYVWPDRSRKARAWWGALASLGVGVALELYQLGLPHRSAELADAVADAAGAALGALFLASRG
jgi:VanZ family protein